MPWQSVGIKPISEPLRPQKFAYEQLWLCAFRLNRGHDAMTLLRRKLVHEAKLTKKTGKNTCLFVILSVKLVSCLHSLEMPIYIFALFTKRAAMGIKLNKIAAIKKIICRFELFL